MHFNRIIAKDCTVCIRLLFCFHCEHSKQWLGSLHHTHTHTHNSRSNTFQAHECDKFIRMRSKRPQLYIVKSLAKMQLDCILNDMEIERKKKVATAPVKPKMIRVGTSFAHFILLAIKSTCNFGCNSLNLDETTHFLWLKGQDGD